MKQAFYFLSFLFLTIFATRVHAQTNAIKCVDPDVQGRADNIKSTYAKQGKVVFQESMLNMTSMEPSPVAVRLQQGVTYEFIFVGSNQASRMMLELFDGADKKLDHKVEKNATHLLYTFTPNKTEVYLVTLTQKKGTKDMCGYFGIMVKKPAQSGPKAIPVKNNNVQTATPVKTTTIKTTTTTTPTKTTTTKTTTTTTTQPTNTTQPAKTNTIPDNQRPNPNRTKATQQYQQQQQKP